MDIAEQFPNVRLHFNQKLKSINFEQNECRFKATDARQKRERDVGFSKLNFEPFKDGSTESNDTNGESVNSEDDEIRKQIDVLIGADGAFSKVRNQIMRQTTFNYEQMYIDHGYIELCIPPRKTINPQTQQVQDDFAMEVNYLHIWPRGEFMMIALPNQNRTYTVTLFMPKTNFDKITDQWSLIEFFRTYFPDSIDLIGRDALIDTFFGNKPSSLITIKCSPYNLAGKH